MTLPSSSRVGLAEHSPAHACWVALRYLRAYEQPVFLGKVANVTNTFLARWGHKSMMDDSIRKYAAQPGFKVGLYDRLWTAGYIVLYGPQRGQKRGHLFVEARQL